jgi:hypothetical protein
MGVTGWWRGEARAPSRHRRKAKRREIITAQPLKLDDDLAAYDSDFKVPEVGAVTPGEWSAVGG